jgi:protease-4
MKVIFNIFLFFVKVIIGTFVAMFIVSFTIGSLATAILFTLNHDELSPSDNAFLLLTFPRLLPELSSPELELDSIFQEPVSFYDLLDAVRTAKDDNEVKGINLDLDNWHLSSNQVQELNEALLDFKKSSKPVVAYATMISNGNFSGALVADCLAMPKSNSAMVSLTGYSRSIPYYKELITKLGVEINVVHIGDYKAYGENYTHQKMSPEFKSELEKVFGQLHQERMIRLSKKLDDKQFQKKLEAGDFVMLTALEAHKLGLVDQLALPSVIEEQFFDDAKELSWQSYSQRYSTIRKNGKKENIAIVTLEGPIMPDISEDTIFAQKWITPSQVNQICQSIEEDSTIKGVVVRINSPGGSALASEMIYQEFQRLKAKLPIYVSMGHVAASGGYYIACGGDKLFAEPQTITGSIGVVSVIPNFSKLASKIGINLDGVTKGKYSDLFAPTKPTRTDDLMVLRKAMLKIYEEFSNRVSSNRKIALDKLHQEIAQGRIWTGNQAKKIGLIDEVGGLEQTVNKLADQLHLKDWATKIYPENRSFLDKLMKVEIDTSAKLPNVLQTSFDQLKLYQFLSHQPLTLCLPFAQYPESE